MKKYFFYLSGFWGRIRRRDKLICRTRDSSPHYDIRMLAIGQVFRLRRLVVVTLLTCAIQGRVNYAVAEENLSVDLNLPTQSLAESLRAMAVHQGLQIVFSRRDVDGIKAVPLKGRFTIREALTRLIENTPLGYEFNGRDTVVIKPGKERDEGNHEQHQRHMSETDSGRTARRRTRDEGAGQQPVDPLAITEEVIVTARKRAERLHDVPIAITAWTQDQIETHRLSNVLALDSLAPNLQVSKHPTSNVTSQIGLRGGVTFNGAMYWEPSVGLYLDGVYLGKAVGSVLDLVDVDRIEVLRGPQGTLEGRNALAGAINMISRKPSGFFSGTVGMEFGNYGYHAERISVDLPKFGIVSASIGMRKTQRDGLVRIASGSSVGELDTRNNLGERLALLVDISPDCQAEYRYDHSWIRQAPPYNQLYRVTASDGPLAAMTPYAAQERQKAGSIDFPSHESLSVQGQSLTLAWNLDNHNMVKSISSRRVLRSNDSFDLDGTPLRIAAAARAADFSQESQELQWVGSSEFMNYVIGSYHYRDDGYTINPHVLYFGTDQSEYGFGARARSLYGQLDLKVEGGWVLSLGTRRTAETKRGSRYKSFTGFGTAIPHVESQASFAATTPMVSLAYRPSEHLNVYAKYSEGFKSGGFQGEAESAAEAVIPFRPEKQHTYEIGAKTTASDGRFELNMALFYNLINDLQISRFHGSPGISVIRNAGEASTSGLELEVAYRPSKSLNVRAAYGYLYGKYDQFMEPAAPGLPITNVAGNRAFPHAPRHTFGVQVDTWIGRSALGIWRSVIDYRYTGAFFTYPYQLDTVDASRPAAANTQVHGYGLLNLRLILSDIRLGSKQAVDAALWVKNANGWRKPINFIDFGPAFANITTAYYAEPRTFGASINYRW